MPKVYPCNARFNDILFGAGSRNRTCTNRVKVCCPTVRLYPYEASSVLRSLFCFFAEFLENHYVEPGKMVFFIFAGIGGTNPRPTQHAISPTGVPFPADDHRIYSAGQGRT